jgi:hypothetical protein
MRLGPMRLTAPLAIVCAGLGPFAALVLAVARSLAAARAGSGRMAPCFGAA